MTDKKEESTSMKDHSIPQKSDENTWTRRMQAYTLSWSQTYVRYERAEVRHGRENAHSEEECEEKLKELISEMNAERAR